MTDENLFDNVQPFSGDLPVPVQESGGALVEAAVQREIAEVQAAMAIAKRFPRNQRQAMDRIIVACQRPGLAEGALYSYAKGGSNITGPSIRLAEALAQNWGNLQFGIRELEQRIGESTVEAFAWDLETNTRQTKVFQVRHVRKARGNLNTLDDPREIYEMVANQGARRMRACILGIIPGDVVDAAVEQCEATLKTKADISPDAIKKMLEKFGEFSVTKGMIEKRIQRNLEAITAAQLIGLRKIFNSLKDGMSKADDWFESSPEVKEEPKKTTRKPKEAPPEAQEGAKAAEPKESTTPAGNSPQNQLVDTETVDELRIYTGKAGLKEEIVSVLFTEDRDRRSYDKMNNKEAGLAMGYLLDKVAEKEEQTPQD